MLQVIKRDKRLVDFEKAKIISAVLKAFKEVDGEISAYAIAKADNIADYIEDQARIKDDPFTIEEIQDLVENGLMSTKRKDVARAYITYREERTRDRLGGSFLIKSIGEKILGSTDAKANANVDENSFGGRKGEAANVLLKEYALNYIVSPRTRKNHLENRIYVHK